MVIPRHVLAYKFRAFLVALAVFSVFALVVGLLARFLWYPGYLFTLDGGLQGLRIVLAVDFVLGPVLALVFFHPEKSRRKLVFDIVVISLLQLGAMGWGTLQIWSQRPLAVVYGNNRFISVAPDIMRRQQETAATLARFPDGAPPFIYRREPQTREESARLVLMLMRYGYHPESQAWLFQPMVPNRALVFQRQAEMQAFALRELGVAWQAWSGGREAQLPEDYRLAFFEGRFGGALLVFSPAGALLGYLPLGDQPVPDLVPGTATVLSR